MIPAGLWIYSTYSKGSPAEGRFYPCCHSWHICLPAAGSLPVQIVSVPVMPGRSFPPAFLYGKFQLEIHILVTRVIQHHYRVIGFASLFAVKPGYGNAALFQ